jgi:ABC-2 type transport system ATP-binding protein
MIRAHDLIYRFGKLEALRGFSLEAESGSITGLLGPNGAGKTTALRILACILRADSGSLEICGLDASEERTRVRSLIGYLPEVFPIYPEMRVSRYLEYVASMRGLSAQAARLALGRVVEACALDEVAESLCGVLSKGYRQRVGLAQALIHDPAILILDEPGSGLDPVQAVALRSMLRSLAPGRTILVSTHQIAEARALCDRLLVVASGCVRGELSAQALDVREPAVNAEDEFAALISGGVARQDS